MRISPRELDALPALTVLAQHPAGIVESEPMTAEENLSHQVLQAIGLELMRMRSVGSVRGVNGGYPSKGSPQKPSLGSVISGIDDPPAPFDDQDSLCGLVSTGWKHRALVRNLLAVRNASANTPDHTSLPALGCCRRN
jgi:DNA-binding IscR family transcriptional regulator